LSSKTYEHLHARLTDLISEGEKIADRASGTPAAAIHEWASAAEYYLGFLEDKVPAAVSEFRRLRKNFEFRVEDDEESTMSPSGYRHERADVLLDFDFEMLNRANEILRFAVTKLEMEGHSSTTKNQDSAESATVMEPANEFAETFAPKKTSGNSYAFDRILLAKARELKNLTQQEAATLFDVTLRQIKRWESGEQKGMHMPNIKKYRALLKSVGLSDSQGDDTQTSSQTTPINQ